MVEESGRSSQGLRDRLTRIETKLEGVEKDISELRSLVKWIALTVGGAILLAVLHTILPGLPPIPGVS